jgi:hypothetical protein
MLGHMLNIVLVPFEYKPSSHLVLNLKEACVYTIVYTPVCVAGIIWRAWAAFPTGRILDIYAGAQYVGFGYLTGAHQNRAITPRYCMGMHSSAFRLLRIPLPGTGVKIALAAAHFHSFGVARQGPWNTWVNKGKKRRERASTSGSIIIINVPKLHTL